MFGFIGCGKKILCKNNFLLKLLSDRNDGLTHKNEIINYSGHWI